MSISIEVIKTLLPMDAARTIVLVSAGQPGSGDDQELSKPAQARLLETAGLVAEFVPQINLAICSQTVPELVKQSTLALISGHGNCLKVDRYSQNGIPCIQGPDFWQSVALPGYRNLPPDEPSLANLEAGHKPGHLDNLAGKLIIELNAIVKEVLLGESMLIVTFDELLMLVINQITNSRRIESCGLGTAAILQKSQRGKLQVMYLFVPTTPLREGETL